MRKGSGQVNNTQQQLLELMVDQVLTKHGVRKDLDLSKEDKKRLTEVVEKLKEDVETFAKKEKKTYTEHDSLND